MGLYDIDNASYSDMTNKIEDVVVPARQIEEAQDQDETEYINTNFTRWWGYFNSIAELKTALIMKATWNVGKGYVCEPYVKVILDHISGDGKQTFNDILFSMDLMKRVAGDSFAEIIKKDGKLVNLKLLNPDGIKIIYARGGRIKRYEQFNKTSNGKMIAKWEPNEIFHFSHNKLAGEMHGISDIEALEPIIKADNENFSDVKTTMRQVARPMILWKLKTDNTVKIAEFIRKIDYARSRDKQEDLFIPDDEDVVTHELIQVNVPAMIMAWRDDLRNKFYRAVGVPQVIFGASTGTESGSKVEYLAHEQVFSNDQRYIEEQVWKQLYLKIKLNPPTSLLDKIGRAHV